MAIVLIADDDLEIIELLKFTFESENYKVIATTNGEEALARARETHPDIVILDVNMPKMTGYEVCEKLREDSSTRLIPIVMLTSLSKTKDKITGIKLGADDYLAKPFEPFEILARVEGLLRRTKESLSANPLTGLPGNISIEEEIKRRLESEAPFAVIYTDIDNFKSYNDKYGFERGDAVIKLTATIIRQNIDRLGNADDFLGNIGGEDFVVVTSPEKAPAIVTGIIAGFDAAIPLQYDEEVRRTGYLWGVSRQGQEMRYPIMSISLGVVLADRGKYAHYSQIVEQAKDMLKNAKAKEGSTFVVG